ncbi:MAG: GAF domain-containing protein [Gemmatimonadota bacterium]|nr:GAF domain-containing protein [Gemmatimonadota bacterium]
MRPLLIVAAGRDFAGIHAERGESGLEVRYVSDVPARETLDRAQPTVVLLDRSLLRAVDGDSRRLTRLAEVAALLGVGDADDREPPPSFPVELLSGFVSGGATPRTMLVQLRGAFRHATSLVTTRAARADERQRQHELAELAQVGVALSTERNLLTLLGMILSQARRLTNSDAGSIYLSEREEGEGPRTLRFMLTQNESLPDVEFGEFTVPVDHTSLAGHVALTGEPLVIADVYGLPADVEYKQNRTFDERNNYRTRSVLVIPLTTQRDETVGVLQLLNRKRTVGTRLTTPEIVESEVVCYDPRAVELVSALASQAAVSIENSLLQQDIERLFEGFVTASITAIESRDPTTSGHSGRVAGLSVNLAETLARVPTGPWRGVRFSREQLKELRYASLLHDFGKVAVREQVLVKAKKLYPAELDAIRARFGFLRQEAQLDFERRRARHLHDLGRTGYDDLVAVLTSQLEERENELDRLLALVLTANEPSILVGDDELKQLPERMFVNYDGVRRPLLSEDEVRVLSIPQGTLDVDERQEIESHVTHTFRFLREIPWTRELRGIPSLAYGHHEKLNGRGYPRGVTASEIPVQTRIMTISDIYDALTASDRPYKKAVPTERALDILRGEAKAGMLDEDLLQVFVEARIYERARPGDVSPPL